ncbi:uncharacterized protein LOC111916284 [Lactuca sativa]|uniref:uncharacterized protein LOC111916284 n=1 Tax=Lactuca sativa TaxID=4236 RepID=UPI000CD83319|nr:uncharacterized protein LOC111916284 [Lactuca sativa]
MPMIKDQKQKERGSYNTMEEVSMMAKAYYEASSDHVKKLAHGFFDSMDNDGDGKIDRREFLEFIRDEGCGQMTNSSFFDQMDRDKNGTLDFFEVMTVYYIVKSGRPFCDKCNKFITSTYLTCVGCLEDPNGGYSFCICLDCYRTQIPKHMHDGLCRFVDNYSLLEAMTKSKLNEQRSMGAKSRPNETNSNPGRPPMAMSNNQLTWNPWLPTVPVPYNSHRPPQLHHSHSWSPGSPSANHTVIIQSNYSYHYPQPPPVQHQHVAAPNNAIVPYRQNWRIALGALNAALQIGALGSNFCSIL